MKTSILVTSLAIFAVTQEANADATTDAKCLFAVAARLPLTNVTVEASRVKDGSTPGVKTVELDVVTFGRPATVTYLCSPGFVTSPPTAEFVDMKAR